MDSGLGRNRRASFADNPNADMSLGPEGLLKRSEFIRLILDALISLGFDDTANSLEKESGFSLNNPVTKEFLDLVQQEKWKESTDKLQELELGSDDKRAVTFLLLKQRIAALLNMSKFNEAEDVFCQKILGHGFDENVTSELGMTVHTRNVGDTLMSASEVVEKLEKIFPPGAIIPNKKLEYLLEGILKSEKLACVYHNVPDDDLSLCSKHHCGSHIPSKTIQTMVEHTDEVLFLKFSHNGKYLASSSRDKTILWEIDIEKMFSRKHTLIGHRNRVVMVMWRFDDKEVITCGEYEAIKRWDVETGECLRSYGVNTISCAWFNDGSAIIGVMVDRIVSFWDLDGNEINHELALTGWFQDGAEVNHEAGQPAQKRCDVAMTSKWFVSTGGEYEILCIDPATFRVEKTIRLLPTSKITSFSLSEDSRYLLINRSTKVVNVTCLEPLANEKINSREYRGSQFICSCFGGYKESFIALGNEHGQVHIWHMNSRKRLCRLEGHEGAVKSVSWNPIHLDMLASASGNRIRIWGS